jgi:hypothetical protein
MEKRHKIISFEYGFIYLIIDCLIHFLKAINLVEWFKKITVCLCFKTKICKDSRFVSNQAIDTFILIKYVFIIWMTYCGIIGIVPYITIYLIFMNIFTYFYYHIWEISIRKSNDAVKRRFISLSLAIIFNILCFTYLYHIGCASHILWGMRTCPTLVDTLMFSISNTFLFSNNLNVANNFGYYMQLAQQITSYIFVAIILTQSIPSNQKVGLNAVS